MQIEILTMFPGEFLGYVRQPHVAEMRRSGQLIVRAHNYCLWTSSETSLAAEVDVRADAVAACLDRVVDPDQATRVALLSPGSGGQLDPPRVRSLFAAEQVVLICGEDIRVVHKLAEHLAVDVFSANGSILATSESAAMSAIDAAVWLLSTDSLESSSGRGSHPHFAYRPEAELRRLDEFDSEDIER